ncbi:crossover junction endodeoxyribonuclease RuvC [Candidatus Liberibacter asiaticus]|uniref:crossover junction endodeoxyribonuclease RuvC n=1 Tax=Liberibacter asiaticus TaxID=34021 RepID=UPI004058A570
MSVLALDLGSKMGFAVRKSDQIFSGVVKFENGRFEGGGMRYLKFQNWLDDLRGIKTIWFEEVRRHLGVDASHAYGGFLAVLASWCERHGIAYSGVPVQTIKKHITGKGNANKALVVLAVKGLGFNPIDDNEADALALLDYVLKYK